MKKLEGKTAVITGATSGIGLQLSLLMVKELANVYLIGRSFDNLEKTLPRLHERPNVKFIQADITRDDDIATIVESLQHENKIDFLIHGAGVISIGLLCENPVENLDHQYKVNVRAPYAITQKLMPQIKKAEGEIIFFNSTAGIETWEGQSQYSASKYALRAIADSLRKECREFKIKVLSIFLGGTATPMQKVVQEAHGNEYEPENFMASDEVAKIILLELKKSKKTMITDMTIRSNI